MEYSTAITAIVGTTITTTAAINSTNTISIGFTTVNAITTTRYTNVIDSTVSIIHIANPDVTTTTTGYAVAAVVAAVNDIRFKVIKSSHFNWVFVEFASDLGSCYE